MTNIRMVPGTAKSVASLALAQMRSGQMTTNEIMRDFQRSLRMEWAEQGALPSRSSFQYAVALGVYMVETFAKVVIDLEDNASPVSCSPTSVVSDMIARSTTGRHELWFSREDGSAFISFEDHDDAVMFELALTGDRS